ncbi:hypothetical protein BKI52_30710 [marine bacterium AO1-C]|nr:hypothetical protein BKI52_30710 [marine bacterium AO1-C]
MNHLRSYYFTCLIICGLALQVTFAQSDQKVTLESTIAFNRKDKAHVDALNRLTIIEKNTNPSKAFKYAQQAEKIAKSLNYQLGLATAKINMGDMQISFKRYFRAAKYHEEAFSLLKNLLDNNQIPKQKMLDFINKSLVPATRILDGMLKPSRRERRAIRRYKNINGLAAPFIAEVNASAKMELEKKNEELKKKEDDLKKKDETILDKESELKDKNKALRTTNYQKLLLARQKLLLSLEKDSLSTQTDTLARSLRVKELREMALQDSLMLQDLEKKNLQLEKAKTEAKQKQQAAELKQKKTIIQFATGAGIIVLILLALVIRSYYKQRKAARLLTLQKKYLADKNEKITKQKEAITEKHQEIITQQEQLQQKHQEITKQKEELALKNDAITKSNREILAQKDELAEMNEEINQRNEEVRMQMELIETQNETIKQEQQIADALLLNILPEQVANELKENGRAKIRHHDMVSVLFTDFKGFTRLAEIIEPQGLVQELEKCFTLFDEIMEKHNLEKIKTIGDAYMAVGGLPMPNTTNFVDIVLAALEMQRTMDQLKIEKEAKGEPFWETRLGINTGKLIAGVIGKKKFAYDVWGDTVNTASRMESSGEVGRVNISGVTYELVKDFFICEYRGKIMAKNKGAIDMYFVNAIKPELSLDGEGIEPNQEFKMMLETKSKEVAEQLQAVNA